ncbi:hypothetical protein D3C86_2262870 [compost metagenome]
MWKPGIFSSCNRLPVNSVTPRLVPTAISPTRLAFSVEWVYPQNSWASSSWGLVTVLR